MCTIYYSTVYTCMCTVIQYSMVYTCTSKNKYCRPKSCTAFFFPYFTGPDIFGLKTALLCIPEDIPHDTSYCFCQGLPTISKLISICNVCKGVGIDIGSCGFCFISHKGYKVCSKHWALKCSLMPRSHTGWSGHENCSNLYSSCCLIIKCGYYFLHAYISIALIGQL